MRETILLILFDVPADTPSSRRQYPSFRSGLKKLGYLMLQKSVYYKMLTNISTLATERNAVEKLVPTEGSVQFLPIPLRVFRKITYPPGTEI